MAGSNTLLFDLIAKIWNGLGGPIRRSLLWLMHAKFIHGVSGVIVDEGGRVLLLKHRFWKDQRWGLPGGLARHRETLGETLRRELREEMGLDVRPTRLLQVNTTRGPMAQFILLAECAGQPKVASVEIIEARFWERTDLPENLLEAHRKLLEEMAKWPGMRLEE